MAAALLLDDSIEGLTVTGGEPTEQPEAVAVLLETFRTAGRNTWLYSGHTLEDLVARDEPALDRLLASADVLVDGRFLEGEPCTGGFRGSRNQRVIPLTPNGAGLVERLEPARLQVRISGEGDMRLTGIPPRGFVDSLEQRLSAAGLSVRPSTRAPFTIREIR